jgi:hypothetical protein
MYTLWTSCFFYVLLISIKHKLCRGTIYWAFLPSWFQLAWWFQRRRLKWKSLRTTIDAKWWLYMITWPFGPSELIRCYQTSHLFQHCGARNVLPTAVKRAAGLIAATEHACWSHAFYVFNRLHWILFKILFRLPLVARVVALGGASFLE